MVESDLIVNEREPNASLLLSYIKGRASASERKQVEEWMAENEENEQAVLQLGRIYFAQRTHQRIASRDPHAAFESMQKRKKGRQVKMWIQRIAVAAACLTGVVFVTKYISKAQKPAQQISQLITVEANPGMRTHIHLPDGTTAYLNSNSTLTYTIPFDEKERSVALKGEAYFKVSHNAEQPCVVSVADDNMHIRVLGTEFNVQAYEEEEDIQTTLVEGSVKLLYKNESGKMVEQSLKPSEKADFNHRSKNMMVKTVDTEFDTAWMDGRLVFKDTPLPEVLKKLSHFYNVKFEVTDPIIRSYNFTGTFSNRQLSQILNYLKISSNINYTINQSEEDDSEGVKYTTIVLRKRS